MLVPSILVEYEKSNIPVIEKWQEKLEPGELGLFIDCKIGCFGLLAISYANSDLHGICIENGRSLGLLTLDRSSIICSAVLVNSFESIVEYSKYSEFYDKLVQTAMHYSPTRVRSDVFSIVNMAACYMTRAGKA